METSFNRVTGGRLFAVSDTWLSNKENLEAAAELSFTTAEQVVVSTGMFVRTAINNNIILKENAEATAEQNFIAAN